MRTTYLHCALRLLRERRDNLEGDRNRLQLRIDTHGDAVPLGNLEALNGEIQMLEDTISFFWRELLPASPTRTPPVLSIIRS